MTEGKRGKPLKRKIITAVFLMVGGSAGITALPYLWELAGIQNNLFNNIFVNIGIGALIFYLLSFLLMKYKTIKEYGWKLSKNVFLLKTVSMFYLEMSSKISTTIKRTQEMYQQMFVV